MFLQLRLPCLNFLTKSTWTAPLLIWESPNLTEGSPQKIPSKIWQSSNQNSKIVVVEMFRGKKFGVWLVPLPEERRQISPLRCLETWFLCTKNSKKTKISQILYFYMKVYVIKKSFLCIKYILKNDFSLMATHVFYKTYCCKNHESPFNGDSYFLQNMLL